MRQLIRTPAIASVAASSSSSANLVRGTPGRTRSSKAPLSGFVLENSNGPPPALKSECPDLVLEPSLAGTGKLEHVIIPSTACRHHVIDASRECVAELQTPLGSKLAGAPDLLVGNEAPFS